MARGLNKAMLIGNLGGDPETRYMPSGGAVTNITVATSKQWKDRESGDQQERTEWHRVVFFNRLAEIAGEYLKKGSKVYIEGELRTKQWEKDGQKHYTTEIIAQEMQMLDSRSGGGGDDYQSDNYDDVRGSSASREDQEDQTQGQDNSRAPAADDFDDDIPF